MQLISPPSRWTKYWRTPLARFDYDVDGRIDRTAIFADAWIPAGRTVTGDRSPVMAWAGTSRDAAIRAARLLSGAERRIEVDSIDGARTVVRANPAVAIFHDADSGNYWITTLEASIRVGQEWKAAVHTIDGAAFAGNDAALRGVSVMTATADLVAIVGRTRLIEPGRWEQPPAGPEASDQKSR